MSYSASEGFCDWCKKKVGDGGEVACGKCYEQAESKLSDAESDLKELHAEIDSLRAEIDDLRAEGDRLQGYLDDLNEHARNLT